MFLTLGDEYISPQFYIHLPHSGLRLVDPPTRCHEQFSWRANKPHTNSLNKKRLMLFAAHQISCSVLITSLVTISTPKLHFKLRLVRGKRLVERQTMPGLVFSGSNKFGVDDDRRMNFTDGLIHCQKWLHKCYIRCDRAFRPIRVEAECQVSQRPSGYPREMVNRTIFARAGIAKLCSKWLALQNTESFCLRLEYNPSFSGGDGSKSSAKRI